MPRYTDEDLAHLCTATPQLQLLLEIRDLLREIKAERQPLPFEPEMKKAPAVQKPKKEDKTDATSPTRRRKRD